MHIRDVRVEDMGYYLCIVGNSKSSGFRVTYAFLNVSSEMAYVAMTEVLMGQLMGLGRIELGLLVAGVLLCVFMGMVGYMGCCGGGGGEKVENRKVKIMRSMIIEKTAGSMKQVSYLYNYL